MSDKPTYEALMKRVDELEQELKMHRDFFEYAPIGIFQSTLAGDQFINVNPAMAQLLGYESTEDCIASVRDIARDIYVQPERRRELLDLAIRQGRLLNYESQYRRADDRIITGKVHVRVARNEDGSISYLEGFVEDISEQKKMAEALKESEEHYRSIFENTGTGAIIVEDDMTITMVNAEFERLSGYAKAEIEGKMKWTEIVAYPEDLEKMISFHRKRREDSGRVPKNYSFTLIDKFKNKKNIYARVDVIPGTKKSLGSFIDITPLIEAQKSIIESESKLRGILEAFEGHIYICSKDYQVTYLNRSLKDSIWKHGTGKQCHQMIYGLDTPCPWCIHDRVFKGETVKIEFQNPRDGRWYYAVNSPIPDVDDTVLKMQTVMIDIHDRKQAELEIKARKQYLEKENIRLRATIRNRCKFGNIIGKSSAMQKVYELILRAAATDTNVIIYGESGTGKELVARAIHDMSARSKNRFVPVHCGAIPQHLLESEFFGYKKGAFTGATQDKPGYLDHAEKGTLFLDEVGEIDLNTQVKLLRVLEDRGYTPVGGVEVLNPDVRIIAATNRNLNQMVQQGKMREDFFYRIHIIPIYLPPLRERKEDIPLLVAHFLKGLSMEKETMSLTGNMSDVLMDYDWPGNVRELENTLQRFVSLNRLDLLGVSPTPKDDSKVVLSQEMVTSNLPLRTAVKQFEREYIKKMLDECQGNKSKVARVLGIGRRTLYSKMKDLEIME